MRSDSINFPVEESNAPRFHPDTDLPAVEGTIHAYLVFPHLQNRVLPSAGGHLYDQVSVGTEHQVKLGVADELGADELHPRLPGVRGGRPALRSHSRRTPRRGGCHPRRAPLSPQRRAGTRKAKSPSPPASTGRWRRTGGPPPWRTAPRLVPRPARTVRRGSL